MFLGGFGMVLVPSIEKVANSKPKQSPERLRCCYHLDDYLLVEHHETGGFGNKAFLGMSVKWASAAMYRNGSRTTVTRWWFQIFLFCIIPTWGNDPIWLIIFQMGWNHQLGECCLFFWKQDVVRQCSLGGYGCFRQFFGTHQLTKDPSLKKIIGNQTKPPEKKRWWVQVSRFKM